MKWQAFFASFTSLVAYGSLKPFDDHISLQKTVIQSICITRYTVLCHNHAWFMQFLANYLEFYVGCLSTESMWYEQFYSSILTVGCVVITMFTMLPVNLIETGHAHRRYMGGYMIIQNKRDWNLTGNMYKVQGLESIPSESSSSQ